MIILLHGEDTFRSRQRLIKLKEGFKKKYDPRGLNIIQLDGTSLNIEDFNKAVATYGFLSSRRMIVIENLSQNKNKSFIETVRDALSELPEKENVVIFWEGKVKKTRGRKKAETLFGLKAGEGIIIEEYHRLQGAKINQWVKKEITARESKIEPRALSLLVSLVGDDLWRMTSEIDKLVNYKKGVAITEADVALIVRAKFDTDIFKLTDALATQDQALALKLLDDQITSGTAIPYLLTMLIRQFRILIQVKDFLEQGGGPQQAAQVLKLHPFVAMKSVQQANNFSLDKLKKIYRSLLQVDERIKSSSFNQRVFFDLLTVEASS